MSGCSSYMSDERYLAALKRIRQSIEDGCPLESENSNSMGDKYNECSWGLCSPLKEHWPDAEDHIFPDLFIKDGRIAPKHMKSSNFCPLDKRGSWWTEQGCFWTCRIFRKGKNHLPTREQVLAFYDEAIKIADETVRRK